MHILGRKLCSCVFIIALMAIVQTARADSPPLYETDFSRAAYGSIPDGWRDLVDRRPSRNWAVDAKGFLRPMLKNYIGLIVYDGALADGKIATALGDVTIRAAFKKTDDAEVFFALCTRVKDANNFYTARLTGDSQLELFKIADGKPELLGSLISMRRYAYPEQRWTMTLTANADVITARLLDEQGVELARVDGKDNSFKTGAVGLNCTTFAAAKSFRIDGIEPLKPALTLEQIDSKNAAAVTPETKYPVFKPVADVTKLNTPFTQLKTDYDVIVAGGGTGGTAAAIQAAHLGAKVLLLEETDWIGGQMSAAAVTTMDDAGCYRHFPVRERGIYREFHESMVSYYYGLDKDPFNAYYSGPTLDQQLEGGYEPKITRAVLYAMIAAAREKGTLDLSVRSKVARVDKSGDTVTGASIEVEDDGGKHTKQIASRILIDATEYGDVIPLTGARYRVGNSNSDKLNLAGHVQDYTWMAVVKEYPQGVPDELKVKSPPPGYDEYVKKYDHIVRWGEYDTKHGKHLWRVYFAWRGMADTEGPLTGKLSERRHTQTGFNGGNDYPTSVGTLEDPATRKHDAREGIYRTFTALYYFQHELGLNWSLAVDEGYDTPANRATMKSLELRPDLEALAVHLPQSPYVRESRRIIGIKTMVAHDLSRYAKEKLFPTSVAMGDYFMDLHRTEDAIETDLDKPGYDKTDGPFQVIFEAYIPEKIDGFLPAEKNLSQSRLVSGATRLQPVTMLTGQASGTIAALAVKQGVQPRQLNIKQVQAAMLNEGSTLVQRWYADVPWNTPIWRATQMLTLYGIMDRPAPLNTKNEPLGSDCHWGVDQPLSMDEMHAALQSLRSPSTDSAGRAVSPDGKGGVVTLEQLKSAIGAVSAAWASQCDSAAISNPQQVTAGEFALVAAKILLAPAKE